MLITNPCELISVAKHNRYRNSKSVPLGGYQSSHVVSTELDNDLYFVNVAVKRSCGRDNGLDLGRALGLNALTINMLYLDRSMPLSLYRQYV